MDDIVIAYISPDMESRLRERITDVLRMRMIQTTDDIKHATVVIHSAQQMPGPGVTLAELAEKLVEQTRTEIFELKEQLDMSNIALDISNIPVVLPAPVTQPNKRKNFDIKHTQQQYSKTKQQQKQMFFNRIKHK